MSEYTRELSAEQLIAYIANDYFELSHDKVRWQRDDHMRICKEWLAHNFVGPEIPWEIFVERYKAKHSDLDF